MILFDFIHAIDGLELGKTSFKIRTFKFFGTITGEIVP